MDYIKQDTAFERWCENNYLPQLAYVIWKKLFKRFNRNGWSEWVTVDNFTLMAEVQIKSEDTFTSHRDKLIESGLIDLIKGRKGSPNKYRMRQLYSDDEEFYTPNIYTPKNRSTNQGQNTGQSAGISQGQNPELTLNKTKTETKTKTIEADKPPRSPKFIPPTAEQVAEYCLERKNGIDGEYFVDFYQSRGWKTSSGTKVTDWKAAVRTWERRNKQGGVTNARVSGSNGASDINSRSGGDAGGVGGKIKVNEF